MAALVVWATLHSVQETLDLGTLDTHRMLELSICGQPFRIPVTEDQLKGILDSAVRHQKEDTIQAPETFSAEGFEGITESGDLIWGAPPDETPPTSLGRVETDREPPVPVVEDEDGFPSA